MLDATANGINLWLTKVFPSLFPFMVACNILLLTGAAERFSFYFRPFTKILFGLEGIAAFPFFLGILSGYPMGAKITAQLYKKNNISLSEAQHILAFSNNPGPLFLIGTIGAGFFHMPVYGYLLWFCSFLGAVLTGILWRFRKKKNTSKSMSCHFSTIPVSTADVFSSSVSDAVQTILLIGGYLILFSAFSEALEQTGICCLLSKALFFLPISLDHLHGCISGLLEMTNGAYLLSPDPDTLPLVAFLVSFGGLSILSQTFGILAAVPISKKDYLKGKILHALFSSLFVALFFPFLERNAQKAVPVFSFFTETAFTLSFLWLMPSLFCFGVICYTIIVRK